MWHRRNKLSSLSRLLTLLCLPPRQRLLMTALAVRTWPKSNAQSCLGVRSAASQQHQNNPHNHPQTTFLAAFSVLFYYLRFPFFNIYKANVKQYNPSLCEHKRTKLCENMISYCTLWEHSQNTVIFCRKLVLLTLLFQAAVVPEPLLFLTGVQAQKQEALLAPQHGLKTSSNLTVIMLFHNKEYSAYDGNAKQKVGNLKHYTDRLQPVFLLLVPNLLVLIHDCTGIASG